MLINIISLSVCVIQSVYVIEYSSFLYKYIKVAWGKFGTVNVLYGPTDTKRSDDLSRSDDSIVFDDGLLFSQSQSCFQPEFSLASRINILNHSKKRMGYLGEIRHPWGNFGTYLGGTSAPKVCLEQAIKSRSAH